MKSFFQKLINPKQQATPDRLAWMSAAAEKDDISILKESIQFLSLFYDDDTLTMPERIATLSKLDNRNRQRIDSITSQYAQLHNPRPELEQNFYENTYFYQRHLFRNYQYIATHYFQVADQLTEEYQTPELYIARALNALFESLKLRYFKLQAAPDGSWLTAYNLYLLAEEHELQEKRLNLYDSSENTNICCILAQGCMLDTLQQSNLVKQKLEIASTLLRMLLNDASLSNEKADDDLFYIDTKVDKGARRARHFDPSESCRYWGTDGLYLKIHKILLALNQKKDLSETKIGAIAKNPAFLETIVFVEKEWSKTSYERQRRKEERHKVRKKANILNGFTTICDQIRTMSKALAYKDKKAYVSTGKSLEERLQAHSISQSTITGGPNLMFLDIGGEVVTITDVSRKGLGVNVFSNPEAWASVGKLVGVSLQEDKEKLLVCLVRSLRQLQDGSYYIGLEQLSAKPYCVEVSHIGTSLKKAATVFEALETIENAVLSFTALYFVSESSESTSTWLIMPRMEHANNKTYELNLFGASKYIKVGTAKEIKDDWALVEFNVVD